MTTRPMDRRPALTFRGDEFTPEFRALLNKAAKKVGKTQSAFIADEMTKAAHRILSNTPMEEIPEAPPPAVIETFRELVEKRIAAGAAVARQEAETNRREIAELRAELAGLPGRIAADLAEKPRPGLVRRLFGG